jgi:hypothetical protein
MRTAPGTVPGPDRAGELTVRPAGFDYLRLILAIPAR